MKKYLILLSSFCCLQLIADSQTQKQVAGTFEIACKVFNYDFKKTGAGLYSFRIDDPEKETLVHFCNPDSLANLKPLVNLITANLKADVDSVYKNDPARRKEIIDSAATLTDLMMGIITYTIDEGFTKDSIVRLADTLKFMSRYLNKIILSRYYKDSSKTYTPYSFIEKLESGIRDSKILLDSKTFTMANFEEVPFKQIVKDLLRKRKVLFWDECKPGNMEELLSMKASALFFEIKSRLEFMDDEPSTAYIKLASNRIKCYHTNRDVLRSSDNDNKIVNDFTIEDVTVEFEDGTIKNLYVDLSIEDTKQGIPSKTSVRFKNTFPISVSARSDPDKFDNIRIFAGQVKEIYEKFDLNQSQQTVTLFYNPSTQKSSNTGYIYFYLSDLIKYLVIADNDREDYSPANQVIHLNKSTSIVELKKEKRSKIITIRAFTDFIGMQENEPNGLVQFEGSRRVNINTNKHGNRLFYYSWFNYLDFQISFTKIEQKDNSLIQTPADLDPVRLAAGEKAFKVNAIDVYRFQKSAFDVNLNLLKVNFPVLKFNLQINPVVGIMRNNFSDTILVKGPNQVEKSEAVNINVANSLRWGGSLVCEFKPENRWGASLGWDIRRFNLLNSQFDFTRGNEPRLNTFWFDGFIKTNEDNRLFLRIRMTYDSKFSNNNFAQMQLGYSVNLFKPDSKGGK